MDARVTGKGVFIDQMGKGEVGRWILSLFPTTLATSLTPLQASWPSWSSPFGSCLRITCCSLCLLVLHISACSLSHPLRQFKCHFVNKDFTDHFIENSSHTPPPWPQPDCHQLPSYTALFLYLSLIHSIYLHVYLHPLR